VRFNNRAEICTLRSQTYLFYTTLHFRLYLPNVEMTLDLEVNEVEVKGLTSLASVAWITDSLISCLELKLDRCRNESMNQ
jgi:hypothetical protein